MLLLHLSSRTCTLVVEISDPQFLKAINTMKGLFIKLIAANISEKSDKTSSATFTNFCSLSESTNKHKIYCSAPIYQIKGKK